MVAAAVVVVRAIPVEVVDVVVIGVRPVEVVDVVVIGARPMEVVVIVGMVVVVAAVVMKGHRSNLVLLCMSR